MVKLYKVIEKESVDSSRFSAAVIALCQRDSEAGRILARSSDKEELRAELLKHLGELTL